MHLTVYDQVQAAGIGLVVPLLLQQSTKSHPKTGYEELESPSGAVKAVTKLALLTHA